MSEPEPVVVEPQPEKPQDTVPVRPWTVYQAVSCCGSTVRIAPRWAWHERERSTS